MGFCPNCRTADPLVEDRRPTSHPAPAVTVALSQTAKKELVRIETGIGELDRVLGGGLVPGSAILLGGEPGVGKSTLMLQAAVSLAGVGRRVMLAATEESVDQVGLRAGRIGARSEEVSVVTDPDVDRIVANDGSFDTGNLAPGATSTAVTLPASGARYHCTLHPTMVGAVSDSGGTEPPCTGIYC